MLMPGRTYSSEAYSWGFNGKEKDDAISGSGNNLDFDARIYDSRLGRWMSVDKMQHIYPGLSPYSFARNSPVILIDPDGNIIRIHYQIIESGKTVDKHYDYTPGLKPKISNEIVNQVHEAVSYVMQNDNSNTFQSIANNSNIVNIKVTNSEDPTVANTSGISSYYSDNKTGKVNSIESTIMWNPELAMKTTNNGAIAPSTILLHEGAHSLIQIQLKTIKEINENMNIGENLKNDVLFKQYTNTEDRKIIDAIESPYIKAVNAYELKKSKEPINFDTPQIQQVRLNHHGTFYKSKGINSITPKSKDEKVDGTSKTDHIKSQQDNLGQ